MLTVYPIESELFTFCVSSVLLRCVCFVQKLDVNCRNGSEPAQRSDGGASLSARYFNQRFLRLIRVNAHTSLLTRVCSNTFSVVVSTRLASNDAKQRRQT